MVLVGDSIVYFTSDEHVNYYLNGFFLMTYILGLNTFLNISHTMVQVVRKICLFTW